MEFSAVDGNWMENWMENKMWGGFGWKVDGNIKLRKKHGWNWTLPNFLMEKWMEN